MNAILRASLLSTFALLAGCPASNPGLQDAGASSSTCRIEVYEKHINRGEGEWVATDRFQRHGERRIVVHASPNEEVTLRVERRWGVSQATFIAADDGTVDTVRDAPKSGDWRLAGADLPFSVYEGERRDVAPPDGSMPDASYKIETTCDDGGDTLYLRVVSHKEGIESWEVDEHHFKTSSQTQHPSGATLLFFSDIDATWAPPVNTPSFAGIFAHAGLTTGHFIYPGTPFVHDPVPLAPINDLFDTLRTDDRIDADNIFVVGIGYGAVAAEYAARTENIRGVVLISAPGFYNAPSIVYPGGAFGETNCTSERLAEDVEGCLQTRDGFRDALSSACLEREIADIPHLIISGADDAVWDACALVEASLDEVQLADVQHHCLDDTGHNIALIPWIYKELVQREAFTGGGESLCYGGEIEPTLLSARLASTLVLNFVTEKSVQ